MSSSRETIIAGAIPPRVMATTAFQPPPSMGPCLSSRHARARLSRWIWSQETWKPFSWGRRSFMEKPLGQGDLYAETGEQDAEGAVEPGLHAGVERARPGQREEAGNEDIPQGLVDEDDGHDEGEHGQRRLRRDEAHEDRTEEDRGFGVRKLHREALQDRRAEPGRQRALCHLGHRLAGTPPGGEGDPEKKKATGDLEECEESRDELEDEREAGERGGGPDDRARAEADGEAERGAEALYRGGAQGHDERRSR